MAHDLDGRAPMHAVAGVDDDRVLVPPILVVDMGRRSDTRAPIGRGAARPTDRQPTSNLASGAASAEFSAEEIAIRCRAIFLVGEHWDELSRRLPRWLDQAYRDDDSLPGEVAVVMMRRYGNGAGSLVKHLRRSPRSKPREDKLALFGEAKRVCREVVRAAMKERDKARLRTELHDNTASPTGIDVWTRPITADRDKLIGRTEVLLTRGAQVWESLCDDGTLDRADWTEDQKWTAIGMMWGFTVAQIGVVRQVKAKTPRAVVANEVATRQMMSTVRRKGAALLEPMSPAHRLEHDLPGQDAGQDQGQEGRP